MGSKQSSGPPRSAQPRRDLVIILLVALAARLLAHLAHRGTPFAAAPILDAELYDSWARELAAGDWLGREVFYANPLYPYLLGLLYKLTGGSAEVARLVQHLLGVGSVALVHLLTQHAFGRLAAAAAAGLAALYLPFIAFEDTLLIATLGTLLTAATLFTAVRASRLGTSRGWLLAGVIAGLSLLARPTLIPLAVLVWLLLRLRPAQHPAPHPGRHTRRHPGRHPGRRAWRPTILVWLVGLLVVIAPVTLRNAVVGGRLVLITAHGGETFYVGNWPGADGGNLQPDFIRSGPRYEHEDFRREASRRLGQEVDLATSSRYWLDQAFRFITAEPIAYLQLELRKLGLILHAYEKGDNLDLESRRGLVSFYRLAWPGYGLVAALGLLGLGWWFLVLRRRRPVDGDEDAVPADRSTIVLLALACAAQVLSLLLYFVTARYRLPLVVVLLPLAGYGVALLADRARRAPRRLALPLCAAAVLLLLLHRPLPADQRNDPAISATNLGFLYETSGDLPRAAAEHRRAAELRPDLPLARFNLGVAERLQGNLRPAANAFEHALQIDPDYAEAWEQLGMTREQGGDLDGALAAYQRAIRLEPDRALFRRDLGRLHLLRREPARAVAAWAEALRLDPGDERTRRRLAALRAAREKQAGTPGGH